MRRSTPIAILLSLLLVLAACGSSKGLDDIQVSKGDTPKVKMESGFTEESTTTRLIREGDGEEVKTGDTVKLHYIAMNGRTGKEFDNSFTTNRPMSLTLNGETTLPGFQKGLVGQNVGSRVLVAVPPADGAELLQSGEDLGLKKEDTMVFLFDILSLVDQIASGTPKKAPADLPAVKVDDQNRPQEFRVTKTTAKKLTKTKSAVLIEGDGPKLEKGQTLTAHYIGQKYPAGDVFDESWSTAARSFPVGVGGLIACWDNELVGKTLGSRVIVACTSKDAYGKDAKDNGQPDGPLIFVIDLLDAI